jgi:hypothetical protein
MDKAVEALGLNLPQLIAQIVNFFVLLFILRLVAYKPILKMLDERKQRIAEGLNAAEIARAEAAAAQANIQGQLDAARKEGQEIVANAQGISTRIQAAVFALLTLVFASMAVESHDEEHHEGHHDEDGSADAHHHEGAAQAH